MLVDAEASVLRTAGENIPNMPNGLARKLGLRLCTSIVNELKGSLDILGEVVLGDWPLSKGPVDNPRVHAHADGSPMSFSMAFCSVS